MCWRSHGRSLVPRTRLAYLATVSLGSAEPTPRQLLLNRTTLASVLAWLEREGLVEPGVAEKGGGLAGENELARGT